VVTAIAVGPPPTVSVKIGGTATATAGLRYMAAYVPRVNDTVWVLTIGTDNIVWGALAAATPAAPIRQNLGINNISTASGAWTAMHANLTFNFVVGASGRVAVSAAAAIWASAAGDAYLGIALDGTVIDIDSISLYSYSNLSWKMSGRNVFTTTPGSHAFSLMWAAASCTIEIDGGIRAASGRGAWMLVENVP